MFFCQGIGNDFRDLILVNPKQFGMKRTAKGFCRSILHPLERAVDHDPVLKSAKNPRVTGDDLLRLVIMPDGTEKLAAAHQGFGEREPCQLAGNNPFGDFSEE